MVIFDCNPIYLGHCYLILTISLIIIFNTLDSSFKACFSFQFLLQLISSELHYSILHYHFSTLQNHLHWLSNYSYFKCCLMNRVVYPMDLMSVDYVIYLILIYRHQRLLLWLLSFFDRRLWEYSYCRVLMTINLPLRLAKLQTSNK